MESIKYIVERTRLPTSKPQSASPLDEYKCKICRDMGFFSPRRSDGSVDYSRVVTCSCSVERLARERDALYWRMCQLPAGTENWTLDKYVVDPRYLGTVEALDAALQLATGSEDLKWLTLQGPADVGKSHLAVGICRQWLARSVSARYVLVPAMLDELRKSYGPDKQMSFDKQMDYLMNVGLLVLDDLGTQKPTEWAMEKLRLLIDHRYVNALPLVVTTNKPLDKLPGDDEHRIGSRLQRFSPGRVIVMDAPEFRLRKAALGRPLGS